MRRKSTGSVLLPPTGSISRSCRTRSNLPCSDSGISPISSRKIVPPPASLKRPCRDCDAPVKAPFTCPNSSDSSKCSGIAAQFTATSGPSARRDSRCTACAMSSFPVPLSPWMSTELFEGATRTRVSNSARIAGELPTRPAPPAASRPPSTSRASAIASRTSRSSCAAGTGFSSIVTAPRRIASTLVATEPNAVITTTGVRGSSLRTSRSTVRPSPSGIRRSVTTAS